jgi:hypothetical protein
MGFPSRFSVFKNTKNMKSNRSPLGAALSASMVPAAKAKHQAKFKRLQPKRLIIECADEDDTDDDDLFLVDAEKPSCLRCLLSSDCDTFSVPSDGVTSDVIGPAVARATTRSPSPSQSTLCGSASSFDAPPPAFLTNKELADRIHEKADMLLKGIAPDRMKTINKLTHLSKTYTASKVKVVNRFFELLAQEQEEEMRNLARLHPQENRNSPVQYELVLRCAGEPDPDKKYLLGKALLCFSVQFKITDKENGGNRKVSSTVEDIEDEFAGEYEPNSFKTKVGMLFGWLKEQGVQYCTSDFNGGEQILCLSDFFSSYILLTLIFFFYLFVQMENLLHTNEKDTVKLE